MANTKTPLLGSIGRPKTVAGVLSNFKKALSDLKSVQDSNMAEVERQELIIDTATKAADAAASEANKAKRVADKLSELLEL